MNTLWFCILGIFAFLIGIILLLFGRPLLFRRSTYVQNLFLALFLFFLMVFFRNTSAEMRHTTPKKKAKTDQSENKDSYRPPELSTREKWDAFKTFWKKLTKVEPKAPDKKQKRALSHKEMNQLKDELAKIFGYKDRYALNEAERRYLEMRFGKAKNGVKISFFSQPAFVLIQLCRDRIDLMSCPLLKYSRMFVPVCHDPIRNNQVADLEGRLDKLLKLKQEGKVEAKDFSIVLKNIQRDLYLYAILKLFDNFPYSNYSIKKCALAQVSQKRGKGVELKMPPDPDLWIRNFEEKCQNDKPSVAKETAFLKAELTNLKSIQPQLNALVADLER